MPEETTVAESPEVAVDSSPVSDAVTSASETSTETEQQQETTEQSSVQSQRSAKEEAREGAIPADIRAHLAQIKAENPKLAEKIRHAFGQQSAMTREFPGGMKEVRELKATIEQYGGTEGLQQARAQIEEIAELDRLWEGKDPRAIDSMLTDYPEQFSAMMPYAIGKFAQAAPEEYNRMACGIIARTLEQASDEGHSPLNVIWMARQALSQGNTELASELIGAFDSWARDFSKAARAVPEKPKENASNDRVTQLERELRDQKSAGFRADVGREVEGYTNTAIEQAVQPFLNGKSLPEGQKEALYGRIVSKVAEQLQANRAFVSAMDKFSAAGDRAGLVAHSKQAIKEILPAVTKTAYRWLYGQQAQSQPTAKKAVQSVPTTATGTPTATDGSWIKVSAPPAPHLVNRDRTSFEMVRNSTAILSNGKKVFWGQQPYRGK